MEPQPPGLTNLTIVQRVVRGSALMALSSQGIRLLANLILTRLLFPEAFGLMALFTVFIVGMTMFSDMGIRPWVQQNKKGDDPLYLDTAWTLQVGRGLMLWGLTIALALPVADFFNEPLLAIILSIAGVELANNGLMPTRVATAMRHLLVARVTLFRLLGQLVGVVIMVLLAWQLRTVWAQVIGSVALLVIMHVGLPGHVNRLRLSFAAAKEIISFGKWIFLSTICGFLVTQGDKLILGKLLFVETLGIYTIGFFLASFPVLLAETATRKTLIPLYRERPPHQSRENFLAIRKLRFGVTGGIFVTLIALGILGPLIVGILYDDRYLASGTIVSLVACAQMPLAIGLTYDQSALARGNSRRFFVVVAVKAALMMVLMLLGTYHFGIVGAVIGQAGAHLLTLPAIIWLSHAHGAWDRAHDMTFFVLSMAAWVLLFWLHNDRMYTLLQTGISG